jgi:alkyl sulfatase BDS1-like metallo-beta-lactamase superfamily hydrolase
VHFGVDVFKPKDKEFFDRIALRLVAERGFDKSLRIVFTNVDEDKRVLQI